MWPAGVISQASFCALVWEEGQKAWRELPWRATFDPYKILVSEVMLQQTQVARVLKKWPAFLAKFPTIDALSAADTSDVLNEWQGMGYNRRALALKRLADICSANFAGALPQSYDGLLALPGVGPATAAGVCAFAYGQASVYIETNVRAVYLHHLYPEAPSVSDKTLAPLVRSCCPGFASKEINPAPTSREWYYALLDYGACLKRSVGNASVRSAHYHKQSSFEGSHRQKRAMLLRIVLADPRISAEHAHLELNKQEMASGRDAVDYAEFQAILSELESEGFFEPLM